MDDTIGLEVGNDSRIFWRMGRNVENAANRVNFRIKIRSAPAFAVGRDGRAKLFDTVATLCIVGRASRKIKKLFRHRVDGQYTNKIK